MKAFGQMLLHFWRAERLWFLTGVAASTATILAGIGLLGLSGWFITASSLAGAAGIGLTFDFFRPSAGIRFLALGRTASRYAERLVTHEATLRLLGGLRVDLLRGFGSLDTERLAKWRGAEMLQRLTADVDALDGLYLRIALPLIVFGLSGSALGLAALLFFPSLALLLWPVLAAGLGIVVLSGRLSSKDARRRAFALEALRVRSIDLVRAQVELAMSGRLRSQLPDAIAAAHRVGAASRRLAARQLASDAALSLLSSGALVAALVMAAGQLRDGQIDGPQLVLILLVTYAAIECIGPLRRGALEVGRTVLAAKRVTALLRPTAPDGLDRVKPPATGLAAVEFDNAGFGFAGRAPLLRRVSLIIQPGEWVGVAGASGSGKSTLLGLAAGLYKPTVGRVLVHGFPATVGSPCVGLLTQRTELLRDTIAANLRLAAAAADDQALWAALEAVELADVVRALPCGLATPLGEAGGGLSGGEERRLALARIVLACPPVWLLDEPTAGLDEPLAKRVMQNLKRVAGTATVIVASHNPAEIALADRLVRLEMPTFDPDQSRSLQVPLL